jgi:chromosome segregation ATPase
MLRELTAEKDKKQREYENLINQPDLGKDLDRQELEFMDAIQALENEMKQLKAEKKELNVSISEQKPEVKSMTAEIEKLELEASKMSNEYDKQREICPNLEMVVKRHTQFTEALQSIGNEYNELQLFCDELQKRLVRKTDEAKNILQRINENIKKIKLSSPIGIDLPEYSIIDFHRENNLIEKYKVLLKRKKSDALKLKNWKIFF